MTTQSPPNTATGLLAKATAVLGDGGYRLITEVSDWASSTSRLFEDAYNIVGVVVFPTCGELLDSWPEQQESLVRLISQHVAANEGKAWDGYLVLLTPGSGPSERERLKAVQYDTTRLRKLVASGDDLASEGDVERVLRSLLPLAAPTVSLQHNSTLLLLPQLLAVEGIPEPITQAVVQAFSEQAPVMERLHEARRGK
jgi:hypothetical protein